MQSNLPQWARKPKHSKEVVATPLGWMVKETGEYLKLVKNLDQKLLSLQQEVEESVEVIQEHKEVVQSENDETLVVEGDFNAPENVDENSIDIRETKNEVVADDDKDDESNKDQADVKPRRGGRRPKAK